MSNDKRKFESRAIKALLEIEKAGEGGYTVNVKYRPQLATDGVYQKLLDRGLVRRSRHNNGTGLKMVQHTTYEKVPTERVVFKRGKRIKVIGEKLVNFITYKELLKKSGKFRTVLLLTAEGRKLLRSAA